MSDPVFFRPVPLTVAELAALTGGQASPGLDMTVGLTGVAPLDTAGPHDLAFLDNPRYLPQLDACRAGAILIAPRYAGRAPEGAPLLMVAEPYRAMARATAALFPAAARPGSWFGGTGVAPGAIVHPEARLEHGVTLDPGAVVGPGAEIGAGTVVGPHAVIGPGVRIGRDCSVGPNASVQHALIGNRVVIHPGVHIGQDGFGFAMGGRGHLKVPQVGRVVIQDDVEIGAGTTIDRGANRDTVVGEGTKIDNQVQIGHNVVIGRHCVLVAKVGISGSTVLEDFVVMAGASASAGHVRIGRGAQIGGAANVKDDVPPGARMIGTPARPVRRFLREQAALERLGLEQSGRGTDKTPAGGQEDV